MFLCRLWKYALDVSCPLTPLWYNFFSIFFFANAMLRLHFVLAISFNDIICANRGAERWICFVDFIEYQSTWGVVDKFQQIDFFLWIEWKEGEKKKPTKCVEVIQSTNGKLYHINRWRLQKDFNFPTQTIRKLWSVYSKNWLLLEWIKESDFRERRLNTLIKID